MVRHIILWNIKEELTGGAREEAKAAIKRELEALKGIIGHREDGGHYRAACVVQCRGHGGQRL